MFPPFAKVTVPFFHTKLNGLTPLAVVLNVAVVPLQLVEMLNGVAIVPASTVSVAGEITVRQAPVTSTLYQAVSAMLTFAMCMLLLLDLVVMLSCIARFDSSVVVIKSVCR